MNIRYYYIVVTIDGNKYFINKDMDYSDNFSDVLRFNDKDDALDFINRRMLQKKSARVIEIIDNK